MIAAIISSIARFSLYLVDDPLAIGKKIADLSR